MSLHITPSAFMPNDSTTPLRTLTQPWYLNFLIHKASIRGATTGRTTSDLMPDAMPAVVTPMPQHDGSAPTSVKGAYSRTAVAKPLPLRAHDRAGIRRCRGRAIRPSVW